MTDKMLLMCITRPIPGLVFLKEGGSAKFGSVGHDCYVVERRTALKIETTYQKQYRALEIPEELVLRTQPTPVVPPVAKPVTNPAAKPAGRKSSAKGK